LSQRDFFAIDRQTWERALELGMNPACLFLVMARGTWRDNSSTKWSVNSLEKYTGIGRRRGKDAQARLIKHKIIKKEKGGKHPKFKLSKKCKDDALIWLPNELVTGIENAVPPLERVRQTGDVLCLRLLIDFYFINSPVDDGGIPRDCVFQAYERKDISETGNMIVYGFDRNVFTCYPDHPVVEPHLLCNGNDRCQDFWDRLYTLIDLGLISFVPFLVESEDKDSEFIHPLIDPYTGDCELVERARYQAVEMIGECYQYEAENFDYVVPVVLHRKNNTVAGIGFLKYRPKTSLTAAGYANIQELYKHWLEIYESVNSQPEKIAIG